MLIAKLIDWKSPIKSHSRSEDSLKVGFYVLLSFSYKNIAKTAFSLVHCRQAEGIWFLYIDGTIASFNSLQIASIVFIVLWVIPFPFAVALGYISLHNQKIPIWIFLFGLVMPFFTCFVFARDALYPMKPCRSPSTSSYRINRNIAIKKSLRSLIKFRSSGGKHGD